MRARIAALAAQTLARRGSNSSWLLIDPLFQSAPTYVAGGEQQEDGQIVGTAVPRSSVTGRLRRVVSER